MKHAIIWIWSCVVGLKAEVKHLTISHSSAVDNNKHFWTSNNREYPSKLRQVKHKSGCFSVIGLSDISKPIRLSLFCTSAGERERIEDKVTKFGVCVSVPLGKHIYCEHRIITTQSPPTKNICSESSSKGVAIRVTFVSSQSSTDLIK